MRLQSEFTAVIILLIAALAASILSPVLSVAALTIICIYLVYRLTGSSISNDPAVSDYRVADTVMLINPDGIILQCNAQVSSMFGYQVSEVIGQPIEFLMDPSLQHRHVKLRDMFFITSGQRRMQNRVWALHKDGSRVHIEVYLEITAPNEKANVVCSIRNIERFWQKEQELLSENRRLQAYQDQTQGMLMVRLSGHLIQSNRFIEQMLFYSQAELKNLTLEDLFSAEVSNQLRQQFGQSHEATGHIDTRIRNSRGHFIRVRIEVVPTDGNDEQAFIRVIDRSAELKLKADHTRAETIIQGLLKSDQSGDCIWIATEGMQRMLYQNQQYTSFWNLSPEETQSNPTKHSTFCLTEDKPSVEQIYQGHMRSDWKLQYLVQLPMSNKTFVIHESVARIAPDGESGYLIGRQQVTEQ